VNYKLSELSAKWIISKVNYKLKYNDHLHNIQLTKIIGQLHIILYILLRLSLALQFTTGVSVCLFTSELWPIILRWNDSMEAVFVERCQLNVLPHGCIRLVRANFSINISVLSLPSLPRVHRVYREPFAGSLPLNANGLTRTK